MTSEDVISKHLTSSSVETTPQTTLHWESYILQYYNAKFKLESVIMELFEKRAQFRKKQEQKEIKSDSLDELSQILREQIFKWDQFIIDNQEKRKRYGQKTYQLKEILKSRTKEVEKIKTEIEKLERITHQMQGNIKRHAIYENFLVNVVKYQPACFNTIDDVLRRFETLCTIRRQIIKSQKEEEERLDKLCEETKNFLKEKRVENKKLTNYIKVLSERFYKAKEKAYLAEHLIYKIKSEGTMKKIEFLNVKKTCWALYQHMMQENLITFDVNEDDFVGQLSNINKVIGLLDKIFAKLDLQ